MKAHLLFRTKDFGWKTALQAAALREAVRCGRSYRGEKFDPKSGLPWNDEALTTDLGLNTLLEAMAQGDDCVFEVARMAQDRVRIPHEEGAEIILFLSFRGFDRDPIKLADNGGITQAIL